MRHFKSTSSILLLFVLAVLLTNCKRNGVSPIGKSYGLFTITDDSTASLNGVIESKTLRHFEKMQENHPEITRLVFEDMPGSEDDETNVQLGRAVHALGMHTHIADNGKIASGAVDLFLAGMQRTRGNNVKVGVHAWASGGQEATDFPVDDPEHDLFLNYYKDIGIPDSMARAFYFFTINAAPAADIHWMEEGELETYEVFTE